MTKLILLGSFIALSSCSHTVSVGDRRLAPHEVPAFMREAATGREDAEFFEKILEDRKKIYEAKYTIEDREVSLTFNQAGELIEKEEDIELHQLQRGPKGKILTKLGMDYPGHKILEIEKRVSHGRDYIDVEIRHASSPSGYWELSFTSEGEFVSRELEDYDIPLTHN